MIDKTLVGRAIVHLRGDLSQREAAQKANVPVGTWCQWERGKRLPREDQVRKFLRGLGYTVEDFKATVWLLQAEEFNLKGSELGTLARQALIRGSSRPFEPLDLAALNVPESLHPALTRLHTKLIEAEEDFKALITKLSMKR